MAIWFALDHKLNLYNCCDCGDEEAALESASDIIGHKPLALIPEDQARHWTNILIEGVTMNSELRTSNLDLPDEEMNRRAYIRVNDHIDVQISRTCEGYVVDLFVTDTEGKLLDLVGTTWVHDNDLIREDPT